MGLLTTLLRSVDDLVSQGYPREVAERIVSGELPMDFESRKARALEQGYGDIARPRYHGTTADILEFNPSSQGMQGPGVYTTSDPARGSEYAMMRTDGNANVMPVVTRGGVTDLSYVAEKFPSTYINDISSVYEPLEAEGITGLVQGRDMVTFRPENIRSALSAAFDPKYTGPNILGQYALPVAAAGLLAAPDEAEAGFVNRGGKTLLEMWHGSPNVFDEFKLPREVGTSNAQMYGHGIYGSDAVDFAQKFRPRDLAAEEKFYNLYKDAEKRGDYDAMEIWESVLLHETPSMIRAKYADYGDEFSKKADKIATIVENTPREGMLAKVNADVGPNDLLDWNKSVQDQPENIKNTLLALGFSPEIGGSNVYNKLVGDAALPRQRQLDEINQELSSLSKIMDENSVGYRNFTNQKGAEAAAKYDALMAEKMAFMNEPTAPELASQDMDRLGIKGIVYNEPDLPANERNYVVFDPKKLNIVERGYADLSLLAGTTATGLLGSELAPDIQTALEEAGVIGDTLVPTKRPLGERAMGIVDRILTGLEVPQRGIQGLSRAGYGLLSGEGLDAALGRGADVVNQGVEETARQLGDYVFDKTGSPELATGAYMTGILGSPL